jgi:mannose-6-phosphate isomerase-like protein (cupin superfamily)
VWFLRTGADTDGDVHDQRVEYLPSSPFPPIHFHPSQDEHFEIESGEMLFEIDGEQRAIRAGDAIDIPRRTLHRARNASVDQSAVVRWETRPALRSSEFYDLENRLGAGMSTIDRAVFAYEYRDVLRLPGAMGTLVPVVAILARFTGRHASRLGP